MSKDLKAKIFGFAAFLVAAVGFVGIALQTSSAATPGQVGDAPRCDAAVSGDRSKAFKVNAAGDSARVEFKVTGPKNCKVQLRTNSFYAQAMDGKPYDKQILYDHNSRIFTPGTYTMRVGIPTKSTEAKGCFYQLDLTYGNSEINVRPVIAYAHGKIPNCGEPKPKPSYSCDSLVPTKIDRTTFRFTAKASAADGAKVANYRFDFGDGTTRRAADGVIQHAYAQPGEYTVRVTGLFTVNGETVEKSGPNCVTKVTVEKEKVEEKPGLSIVKKVDGVEHKVVGVEQTFTYGITVTNTGNVALANSVVSDTPPQGVTLLSADAGSISNNTWSHTIPSLAVGEAKTFSITAKVPTYLAGTLKNTACVENPKVGQKLCDDATVEVIKPVQGAVAVCKPGEGDQVGTIITVPADEKDKYLPVDDPACKPVRVCNPDTKTIITVAKSKADKYLAEDDPACDAPKGEQPAPVEPTPPEQPTPPAAIPSTGPETMLSGLFGSSAIGYGAYSFAASRRNLLEKLLSRR